MAVPREEISADAPVCEVDCVHADIVQQIKPHLGAVSVMVPLFKALADDTRAKVALALAQSELCVCDVAAVIGCSKATASYHLRLLHHMGLAHYRRAGKLVYYRLAEGPLLHWMRDLRSAAPRGVDAP